ncbi:Long chain fatty acid-CoA ligase [Cupriavidus taiwanensis]|uniref:Long chain fatty acid-CoA ligase n=1 Tax=Cupriavidus taiwanensis TaxID=164546 RepID=A0A375E1H0_9BURK|nr:AMP-binding protein [Cupriavidus taiwanensis]SOZ55492.1 Long chain fatty acid-CoA ligase [Cupriavidus taiwanensis]SOZ56968.1 Long chain fatty acid-CoA ligase [Cupriavidus taiwanensis]SOZ59149.1 Long chain fatty acid-CoA ligase [Cupriavidus taiwanensis]SPA05553.1 Long chain fatty acid-CoA ligase [Cupriavidus taiwanensis]
MNEQAFFADLEARHRKIWPAGLPDAPVYPHGEAPLGDYLRAWARKRPDHAALVWYGTTVTYAELDDLSERCAALLKGRGVGAGDRVAVMMGNCPQFHVVFYAILKLGAVYVPVNPLFKEHELVYELNDAGATTIIVQDQLAPLLMSVRAQTALRAVYTTSAGAMLPAQPELPLPAGLDAPALAVDGAIDLLQALRDTVPVALPPVDLDALAALNYTGGTTGLPKGCMHTQRDMLYTAAASYALTGGVDAARLAEGSDDVMLNFLPMFWIAGENLGLIYPIFSGATVVLLARWDPVAVMAAIERYRVNRTFVVVDNAVELMNHPECGRYDLRSLQHTRAASFIRKITPDIRQRWHALTGSIIAEGAWGMTETHTSDTFTTGMQADDLDLRGRPVFVGLPVPGTRIKICDFDTGAVLPIGEEGEIVVSTPSLFKGYWGRPDVDAEVFRDGWFRTGDIGAYDEAGYLHFLGRRKEMLKVRGMSVFPSELEVLLSRHPAVLGSAVVGRPDPDKGQVPVAFIRLRPEHADGTSADALHAWCREQMAVYKVPEIRILPEFPLTATGKVRKVELQALLDTEAGG